MLVSFLIFCLPHPRHFFLFELYLLIYTVNRRNEERERENDTDRNAWREKKFAAFCSFLMDQFISFQKQRKSVVALHISPSISIPIWSGTEMHISIHNFIFPVQISAEAAEITESHSFWKEERFKVCFIFLSLSLNWKLCIYSQN